MPITGFDSIIIYFSDQRRCCSLLFWKAKKNRLRWASGMKRDETCVSRIEEGVLISFDPFTTCERIMTYGTPLILLHVLKSFVKNLLLPISGLDMSLV